MAVQMRASTAKMGLTCQRARRAAGRRGWRLRNNLISECRLRDGSLQSRTFQYVGIEQTIRYVLAINIKTIRIQLSPKKMSRWQQKASSPLYVCHQQDGNTVKTRSGLRKHGNIAELSCR